MAFYQTPLVVQAVEAGYYRNAQGEAVDWKQSIVEASLAKRSIPPWRDLPTVESARFSTTTVQVWPSNGVQLAESADRAIPTVR